MMGLRGESMNPMTFGNMTHPKAYVPYEQLSLIHQKTGNVGNVGN